MKAEAKSDIGKNIGRKSGGKEREEEIEADRQT